MFNPTLTLSQLTNHENPTAILKLMIGAFNFAKSDDDRFVSFRFKSCRRMNYCKITLNSNDTYTMELGKVGKFDYKEVKKDEGLYFDMLKDIFESATGLALDFPTVRFA